MAAFFFKEVPLHNATGLQTTDKARKRKMPAETMKPAGILLTASAAAANRYHVNPDKRSARCAELRLSANMYGCKL